MPNVYSSNTLSHAQKILPFLDKYAVGTFGLGQILGKSIYFILRELEVSLLKNQTSVVQLMILHSVLEVIFKCYAKPNPTRNTKS